MDKMMYFLVGIAVGYWIVDIVNRVVAKLIFKGLFGKDSSKTIRKSFKDRLEEMEEKNK